MALFEINEKSSIPIWLQLKNRFIYLITSGYYKPGDQLPTVRGLAADVEVNYNTVSKVYQDIERDGYIVSKRGRGTFVHDKYRNASETADNAAESLADAFIQQCRELGVPRADIVALVESRLETLEG